MDDKEYIRTAVELAEHWWGAGTDAFGPGDFHRPYISLAVDSPDTRFFLDALAAQLVRQVDALETHFVVTAPLVSKVYESLGSISERIIAEARGSADRAMNTIRAIVDSGALTTGNTDL